MKFAVVNISDSDMGRTPHGVRGLKLGNACDAFNPYLSHPSRGAWIEITVAVSFGVSCSTSHPSRGAWIEITAGRMQFPSTQCRTPHGVRGLKFLRYDYI